jgi:predicted nucleotidyltransferase
LCKQSFGASERGGKALKREDYFQAVDEVVNYIKSINLEKWIIAAYLGGSMGRGDFIPGQSDIDIYIVTEEENSVKEKLIADIALDTAIERLPYLADICDNPITIAFTTIDAIKSGNSWLGVGPEYFSFCETSKLILGEDIKKFIPIPSDEQIKSVSKQGLQVLKDMLKNAPEPIIEDNVDYILKGVVELAFSAMHLMLSFKGNYCRGKKEIVEEYMKVSRNDTLNKICEKSLNMWYEQPLRSSD